MQMQVLTFFGIPLIQICGLHGQDMSIFLIILLFLKSANIMKVPGHCSMEVAL